MFFDEFREIFQTSFSVEHLQGMALSLKLSLTKNIY